jgi:ribosomal protein L24E
MALVETIHGRHSKYEIYREYSAFGSPTFYVRKDGRSWYSCSSLSHAVDYIRKRDS